VTEIREVAELLDGAVDCYIHAAPDLLPRRVDDLALATESQAAGLAAVIHRHHYASTAERSQLARDATGFPVLGAILLNDPVGGLNPTAVRLALEMSAEWVSMPTLDALAFRRARATAAPTAFDDRLAFGPGQLAATDDTGALTSATSEIIDLVVEAGVPLNLGYLGVAEMIAVARAASERGHRRLVVTNALLVGERLGELLAIPGMFVEVTSYSVHPDGLGGANAEAGVERNVELIRRVGPDRVVLSSDGGMAGSPPPAEILGWAVGKYLRAGIDAADVRAMVADNPRRLLRATALG